jgi:hypothetical protein
MNEDILDSRQCGDCMMCCKLPRIDELKKPANKMCSHAKVGIGCTQYENRPNACRDFYCLWVLQPSFDERWKPNRCGFIIAPTDERALIIVEDPNRPNAYRKEPFYSYFKDMAQKIIADDKFIVATNGRRGVLILPDRDVEFRDVKIEDLQLHRVMRNGQWTFDFHA